MWRCVCIEPRRPNEPVKPTQSPQNTHTHIYLAQQRWGDQVQLQLLFLNLLLLPKRHGEGERRRSQRDVQGTFHARQAVDQGGVGGSVVGGCQGGGGVGGVEEEGQEAVAGGALAVAEVAAYIYGMWGDG